MLVSSLTQGNRGPVDALKVLPTPLSDALPGVVLALLSQNALLAPGHHLAPRSLRDDLWLTSTSLVDGLARGIRSTR